MYTRVICNLIWIRYTFFIETDHSIFDSLQVEFMTVFWSRQYSTVCRPTKDLLNVAPFIREITEDWDPPPKLNEPDVQFP